jgi:hypothetical protein
VVKRKAKEKGWKAQAGPADKPADKKETLAQIRYLFGLLRQPPCRKEKKVLTSNEIQMADNQHDRGQRKDGNQDPEGAPDADEMGTGRIPGGADLGPDIGSSDSTTKTGVEEGHLGGGAGAGVSSPDDDEDDQEGSSYSTGSADGNR